jgi:hypothetical protein
MKEAKGGKLANHEMTSFSDTLVVLKISGFLFILEIAGDVYALKSPIPNFKKFLYI